MLLHISVYFTSIRGAWKLFVEDGIYAVFCECVESTSQQSIDVKLRFIPGELMLLTIIYHNHTGQCQLSNASGRYKNHGNQCMQTADLYVTGYQIIHL